MTPADVPAIPPEAVEICQSHSQVVCPVIAGVSAMWVDAPAFSEGMLPRRGRIVRFEPTNVGETGAWVLLRDGSQDFFPIRELTLIVGAQ